MNLKLKELIKDLELKKLGKVILALLTFNCIFTGILYCTVAEIPNLLIRIANFSKLVLYTAGLSLIALGFFLWWKFGSCWDKTEFMKFRKRKKRP